MEMLIKNKYAIKKIDKKAMKEHGFRYNKKISNEEDIYYSLRFPLLKYLKSITVEGEIAVNMVDGSVQLNAYTYKTDGFYPPFYQSDCSNVYQPIVEKINNKFYEIFNNIGIKKI